MAIAKNVGHKQMEIIIFCSLVFLPVSEECSDLMNNNQLKSSLLKSERKVFCDFV